MDTIDTIVFILLAFLCIGFGLFSFFQPEDAISLQSRWKYNRADPSEKYIRYTQIEGIIMAVAGAVFLVVLLFFPQS